MSGRTMTLKLSSMPRTKQVILCLLVHAEALQEDAGVRPRLKTLLHRFKARQQTKYSVTIMASYQHRTAPLWRSSHNLRGRYSLRGNPQVVPVLEQTAAQQRKNRVAKAIDKSWRITRTNTSSRGLGRQGNTCYVLSGIQALLHLPRFVNWISSHNSTQPDETVMFPCRTPGQTEQELMSKLSLPGSTKLRLTNCPACIIKQLVQAYWDDVNTTNTDPPVAWQANHTQLRALRRLDRRLFPLTNGAGAMAQQDPAESQDRLLDACLASTDYT